MKFHGTEFLCHHAAVWRKTSDSCRGEIGSLPYAQTEVESLRGGDLQQTKLRKTMKIRTINKLVATGLVMLAVGGSCSFADAGIVGINYGPYHKPGQSPEKQSSIPDSQFNSDLTTIAQKYSYIRRYGVEKAGRLDQLVPLIAKDLPSMKVYLGVYESMKWPKETETQLETAIALANKYPNIIEYVVVGNECLEHWYEDGRPVGVDKLIRDINYVKDHVPGNVKVTTCLGFSSALNPERFPDGSHNPGYAPGKDYGKKIMKESKADCLMFTIYPFFWEWTSITRWQIPSTGTTMPFRT
jgi:hypothetical protein